jgi:hypothetical protein
VLDGTERLLCSSCRREDGSTKWVQPRGRGAHAQRRWKPNTVSTKTRYGSPCAGRSELRATAHAVARPNASRFCCAPKMLLERRRREPEMAFRDNSKRMLGRSSDKCHPSAGCTTS